MEVLISYISCSCPPQPGQHCREAENTVKNSTKCTFSSVCAREHPVGGNNKQYQTITIGLWGNLETSHRTSPSSRPVKKVPQRLFAPVYHPGVAKEEIQSAEYRHPSLAAGYGSPIGFASSHVGMPGFHSLSQLNRLPQNFRQTL